MKLQVTTKELQRAMTAVSKIIRSKNSTPILDNVMFHQKNDKFFLTTSDINNEITVGIDMMLMDGKFNSFCLDPKVILPTLANLPEQPLNITVNYENKSYATCVEYLGGSFNVVAIPSDEFPVIAGVQDDNETISFDIDTNIFLPCIHSASLNAVVSDELRPVMQSVLLDVKEDGVTFVASTGHILYKYPYCPGAPFGNGIGSIMINRAIISAIEACFRQTETVHVKYNGKHAEITSGDIRFVTVTCEGRYPNYESVIPTNPPYHITVNVKAFMAALKRVSLFSSDTSHLIKLQVNGGKVELSAQDIDFAKSSKEVVEINDMNIPDGFAIGFKDSSVIRHLATVNTDNAVFYLCDAERAFLIRDDDRTSGLTLLAMPMLIQD